MAAGLMLGLSLIVAVSGQDVRQGMLRVYVLLVVGICSASDVVLIAAGVADRDRRQALAAGSRADRGRTVHLRLCGTGSASCLAPRDDAVRPSRPATSRPAVTAACLAIARPTHLRSDSADPMPCLPAPLSGS
jgi:hypothetical protein